MAGIGGVLPCFAGVCLLILERFFHHMKADTRMQGAILTVLVFAFAFLFVSSLVNTGNVTQLSISSATPTGTRVAAPPPTPACTYVLPTTVNGTHVLCTGTYTLTSPISVSANSALKCQSGVNLIYGGASPYLFDGVKLIGDGASIEKCAFQGKFLNAVSLSANKNMRVIQNTIDGAQTGIFEEPQSSNNLYQDNVVKNTTNGFELQGSNSLISGGIISKNSTGILVGVYPSNFTFPNSVCSTGQNGGPILCSIPTVGKNQKITRATIRENGIGIETYGLDTEISENRIEKNTAGIQAQAIFTGSENNPYGYLQEYFNSGVQILKNTIRGNAKAGIILQGYSVFYFQLSQQYWHSTLIKENIITAGNGTQGIGVLLGATPAYASVPFTNKFEEYTVIQQNTITNNKTGLFLREGGFSTDVLENTIQNNIEEGVLVGETGGYSGAYRFLYKNTISANGKNGVHLDYSIARNTFLNQVNNNGERGFYASNTAQNTLSDVLCNDFSNNAQQGFFYDGYPTISTPMSIEDISKNRIINNGSTGLELNFINVLPNTPWEYVARISNNHIFNNARQGVKIDGLYGGGFFANNIYANMQNPQASDTGKNTYEDQWDEAAFAASYNQYHCKYNTACTYDNECGFSWAFNGDSTCNATTNLCECAPGLIGNATSNTCQCYEDAPLIRGVGSTEYLYMSYPNTFSPVGNYWGGVSGTITIPPSSAPPLFTCTQDSQCPYKTCNLNTQQCGNYDTLPSTQAFTGYYYPGIDCGWYYPIVPYFFPNNPPIDPWGGEEPVEEGAPQLESSAQEWCSRMRIPSEPDNRVCANAYIDHFTLEQKRLNEMKK